MIVHTHWPQINETIVPFAANNLRSHVMRGSNNGEGSITHTMFSL